MNIVDRFIKYARIDTQSDENSTQTPSTQSNSTLQRGGEGSIGDGANRCEPR